MAAMSDRLEQLALRRRQLLLQSERLRADFGADQRVVLDALKGVDRAVGTVRRFAPPALLAGGGLLLLALLRRRPRAAAVAGVAAAGARPMTLAMRSLAWVTLARRLLTIITVARAVARARRARAESQP
jgi:hypothetical protein